MGVNWTAEQQKVIDLRNRNILVSAAAGSGKTAVLVERIITMLTEKENPVDVDRLLIVTFTEAAAAEMKERIANAIEKALENDPDNLHLQRQATLIHSALITTIHSFCLSVIRDYFHVLDMDPGFRIADEGELKLLKQDVLGEVLEEFYEAKNPEFLDFVEKFGSGRNDKKIEEIILQVYEYTRGYPQPEKWLLACEEMYKEQSMQFEWSSYIVSMIKDRILELRQLVEESIQICEEADGPYMYGEMCEKDEIFLEKVLQCNTYDNMYALLHKISWARLSTKKDETVSEEKKSQVKSLRDIVKKRIKDLGETFFYATREELEKDIVLASTNISMLCHLVNVFEQQYQEKKQSKNLIDFSDMEHYALKILTEEKNGMLIPSKVAKEYQEKFVEVMIDEYQDSNLIQEAILTSVSTIHRNDYNIFMVGDVKQSIYRFRLSRPELFMEKYNTYSQEDSKTQRIDLHKNFRSRQEVLDSVNFIFRQIMRKEIGGVSYDDQAALYKGAAYEQQLDELGASINKAELILVDPSKEETMEEIDETATQMEARVVAKRIKELRKNGRVLDKETGEYRTPDYKDIVILTRSRKGWADTFAEVLMEEGIPAYSGGTEGYFETYEISVLLDYLKILDNFRQEMPLTAVLTSPFVGISAKQLAEIKIKFPENAFYEAVVRYSHEEVSDLELQRQLQNFLETYSLFREKLPFVAIHDLLWEILETTGYKQFISAMPGGVQREANIEMLLEKAATFEKTSYKGLFNFVRYIEQLKKYDVDYGEANIEDEQSDTVRIMTIHKSKGLEFPIVFVSGMGKKFNGRELSSEIVLHSQLGIGINAIDLKTRTKTPTILKKLIQEQLSIESLGEELRVLYVALTRAKEKLIMTGQLSEAEETIEKQRQLFCGEQKKHNLPVYSIMSARCYLDWIIPCIVHGTGETPIEVKIESGNTVTKESKREDFQTSMERKTLERFDVNQVYDDEMNQQLENQLTYVYPFYSERTRKMKVTVSELKKQAYLEEEIEEQNGEILFQEPEIIPLLPKFLSEDQKVEAGFRGTSYHKLLEILDFTKEYNRESLNEAINQFVKSGQLSKEMSDCIRQNDILLFWNSNIAKRMKKAASLERLKKEQPFVLGVHMKDVYPQDHTEEMVLIQGIIDVYFEENEGLILVDYKTDFVNSPEELKEKYHTQLEYYATALETLLGKKVKQKIIYSFRLQKEIIL